jgi:anti-anti-sigma regulatory factor
MTSVSRPASTSCPGRKRTVQHLARAVLSRPGRKSPIPPQPPLASWLPGADAAPVIPIPPVLDTPAVVLVGILLGQGCDVVLDGSSVHTVEPEAADALARLLDRLVRTGGRVVLHGVSPVVRGRLAGHELSAFIAAPGVVARDEAVLTCPFLEGTGFRPSPR